MRFGVAPRHSALAGAARIGNRPRVVGTLINTGAILLGGVAGLGLAKHLTPARQAKLRLVLALLVVYVAGSTFWNALDGYEWGMKFKLFGVTLVALMAGNALGLLLRLQRMLNAAGRHAQRAMQRDGSSEGSKFSEGFVTTSLLFCVGPMAIIGSVQDGLTGNFQTLALKGLLDGLATMGFIGMFGWGVMLSALPVLAYQGTLTLLARWLQQYLGDALMVDAINATGGWLVLFTALVILDVKKVPLGNYLPSLVLAPLLARWWLG
jgi:uncharacterized protein